ELLWIYQAQSNDVSWLHQRGNHIWDEWAIKDDGYWYASQNVSDNNGGYKLESVKKYFGKDYAGTIGTAYGFINNKFKRPQYVLNQLKNNPHDRRMVISLWQDEYMSTAVLPSCVWNSEWKVMNNRLHVFVHQRSCDVALGLPFNVSQYAILLCMFATVSGLKIGNLNWSIMDAHIYENQIEQMKLLLKRFRLMEKWEQVIKENSDKEIQFIYDNLLDNITKNSSKELLEDKLILELMIMKKKPFLTLASLDDFFAFDNSEDNKDIKLSDYVSAPFIAMPIAQ
ncbi:MAG: thymidylate synthase, partial [Bacilli bacterium]